MSSGFNYLNSRTILRRQDRITRQERVKMPVNTTQRIGNVEQAGEVHWFVSQNGRRSPEMFVSPEEIMDHLQLTRARRPAKDSEEIFSLDEGSDEEMERNNNLACRDYSRKNLEIVARHKETLWKSDITQRRVGWNSIMHGSLKEMPTATRRMPSLLRTPSRLQKGWNFLRGRSSLMARMGSNPSWRT